MIEHLNWTKEEFKAFFKRDLTNNEIEKILKDFFLSNLQIEEYLEKVNNEELRKPILTLAVISAASDGFDIKENLAYQKALSIWNLSHEMVLESE